MARRRGKSPCDIGYIPKIGERLGYSGATIQDGWVFGLKWGLEKRKRSPESLQKFVVITEGRGEKSWEYYYKRKNADSDAKLLRKVGYKTRTIKCS